MRTRIEAASLGVLLVSAALLAGCSRPVADVKLAQPVVEPEPQVAEESTLLEKFREVCQSHQTEKARANALDAQLAENVAARRKAEGEAEALRKQVETLQNKVQELDALKVKFTEVQKASLELEGTVRDLRKDLLEARLTGAKQEQTILAFKIEKAKEQRRRVIDPATAVKETAAAAHIADKGEEVANP